MKKLLYCILILITGFTVVSCSDDSWGSEGELEKQHWYFFGFEQWHTKPNDIKKDVNQGETLVIPMHFWSERPQNGVHAEVEYFIVTSLQLGVDFQIVNESGTVIAPETDGGYKMVWPNCEKGTQNVYLKALQGAKERLPCRHGIQLVVVMIIYLLQIPLLLIMVITRFLPSHKTIKWKSILNS